MEQGNSMEWLAETWAACLGRVVESMTGDKQELQWVREMPSLAGPLLWWEQGFDLLPQPAAWIGAPEDTWSSIGVRALRSAGVEEVPAAEAKGTWTEILSQSFSAMAQAMGERNHRVVTAKTGGEVTAAPSAVQFRTLQLAFAGSEPLFLQVAIASPLVAALEVESGRPDAPAAAPAAAPATAPAPENAPLASKTFDLLRDVELPVSISFGRAHMPIQEVLKLTAGSVVELDRAINDPVALIVNETVVALGEVVVIEGNYGLRIQRIMGRDNLLRTSGAA